MVHAPMLAAAAAANANIMANEVIVAAMISVDVTVTFVDWNVLHIANRTCGIDTRWPDRGARS